jgi:signal transduction histidine kinase
MKNPLSNFSRLYESVIRTYLTEGFHLVGESVEKISKQANFLDLKLQDIAAIHEQLLVVDLLPESTTRSRTSIVRHGGTFFAAVVTAVKKGNTGRYSANLEKTIALLSVRNVEIALAKQKLDLDILRREKVEMDLRQSEKDCLKALKESEVLRMQLKELSRQVMVIQEEERKKISRELHDVIAQALLGINVRLATLKIEAGAKAKGLNRNITETQKVITKSANLIYQFARELRPSVLDHLGLIPALHSFLKNFTTRTGVRSYLKVFSGIENIDPVKLIVLYRVAQEALTNVARHANASRVEITIVEESDSVCMEIADDGKSFRIQEVMMRKGRKSLGLLGMRERIEMIGGSFKIDSTPGNGTTITACIPNKIKPNRKVR